MAEISIPGYAVIQINPSIPAPMLSENFNTGTYSYSLVPVFSGSMLGATDAVAQVSTALGNGYTDVGFYYITTAGSENGGDGKFVIPSPLTLTTGSSGQGYFTQFRMRFGPSTRFAASAQSLDQIKIVDCVPGGAGDRTLATIDTASTVSGYLPASIYGDGYTDDDEADFAGLGWGVGIAGSSPRAVAPFPYNVWVHVQLEVKAETSNGANDGYVKIWINNNNYDDPSAIATGSVVVDSAWNSQLNFGGINFNGNSGADKDWVLDDYQITSDFHPSWFTTNYDSFQGIRWIPRFSGSLTPLQGSIATSAAWTLGDTGVTLNNTGGNIESPCFSKTIVAGTTGTAEGYLQTNFGDFPTAAIRLADPDEEDLIIDFYSKFDSAVEASAITWPNNSYKLFIVQTHHTSGDNNRSRQVYMYLDANGRYALDYSDIDTWTFSLVTPDVTCPYPTNGSYDHIQIRVKLNTLGVSDGIVQGWINGIQYWNQTGLDLRGSDAESFNRLISGFYATSGWAETSNDVTFTQSDIVMYSPSTTHPGYEF